MKNFNLVLDTDKPNLPNCPRLKGSHDEGRTKAESGDGQGGSPVETAASGRPRAGLPDREPQNRGGRKPAPAWVRVTPRGENNSGRTRVYYCVYHSIPTTPLIPQQ